MPRHALITDAAKGIDPTPAEALALQAEAALDRQAAETRSSSQDSISISLTLEASTRPSSWISFFTQAPCALVGANGRR